MDCCDVNGLRGMFRGRVVEHERRTFKQRGLNRRQQAVTAAAGGVAGARLLDIGCGIAAVSLTLLEQGAEHATLVDVSPDYLEAARELAGERGLEARISVYQGDFVELPEPDDADVVLLDRVVCCYPDAEALLERAARSSRQRLVLTYPKRVWWMRLFGGAGNLVMRLLRRDYRIFLHPPETIIQAATSAGHELVGRSAVGLWQLVVFERKQGMVNGEE